MRFRILALLILLLPMFTAAPALADDDPSKKESPSQTLTLRDALARGIAKNLDLWVARMNIPASKEDVAESSAVFDPALEAKVYSAERKMLTGSVLTGTFYDLTDTLGASAGVRKRFDFGLESSVVLETSRTSNNSLVDTLDPAYRNVLALNLTQPLLRDFGKNVNTAQIRLSKNQVEEAALGVLDSAQTIGLSIENAYYSLAEAQEILRRRQDSLELARDLLEQNRKKLDRGLATLTDVTQSETAVASREEQVIYARQQLESVAFQLKNLLDIRSDDPRSLRADPMPGTDSGFPGFEDALGSALENRPDILRQRRIASDQDIRLEYLENQKAPRVDLMLTLGANGLSGGDRAVTFMGPEIHSTLTGDYGDSWSSIAEGEGYEWAVGMKVSYPLGNQAAKARYRKAEWQKRQIIYGVKSLEGRVETQVADARVAVTKSLERSKVAARVVDLAQKTLDQEMRRLAQGLSDTFRVLKFQDDLIAAKVREIQTRADFNRGLAGLYRSMGENLKRHDIVAGLEPDKLESPMP